MENKEVKETKTKKKLSKKALIIIGIVGALILAGGVIGGICLFGSKKETDEPKDDVKPTPTATAKPEKPVQIIDVNSKTRPYGVMINCRTEALPQAGLQDAYIVYELMVEGGITRMFALFKDVDVSKIGSIRSVRNQYIGYAFENDAIIVHAGGSYEATYRMNKESINHIDVDNNKYGQRDKELAKKRAWEHTLFTNTSLLSKAMNDKGLRKTTDVKNLLTYSAEELDLSKYKTYNATDVSIKYSNYRTANYEYDKTTKKYLRSMNNTKNNDLITKEQYAVKNIIVYGVKHTTYSFGRDSGYQKLSNVGSGEGYYITDGVALRITWEKKNEKSQTVYKITETGEDLIVNDGNTYIQIYPTNGGKLSIS